MLGSDLENTRWKTGNCEVDQVRQLKIPVALRKSLVVSCADFISKVVFILSILPKVNL